MKKLAVLLLALVLLAGVFISCESGEAEVTTEGVIELGEFIDYAATLKFNPNSGRLYTEATVKTFVDGVKLYG